MSVRPSVCPHGTTRLPLDGFSWNFIFPQFSKICRENSSFIKIWQEQRILYTTSIHIFDNISLNSSWNRKVSRIVAEKIKTHILCPITFFFFFENRAVYEMLKILQSQAGHRWQYGACVLHAGYLRPHTLSICNTYCSSTTKIVTRTHLNVTLYAHCLSCCIRPAAVVWLETVHFHTF